MEANSKTAEIDPRVAVNTQMKDAIDLDTNKNRFFNGRFIVHLEYPAHCHTIIEHEIQR